MNVFNMIKYKAGVSKSEGTKLSTT